MASCVKMSFIQNLFEEKLNKTVSSITFTAIGGGSINNAYKIIINQSENFFCKINSATRFPSLLIKEKNGLKLLASQKIIKTPLVVACEEFEGSQILLLEWIGQGLKTKNFWKNFGGQLAKLHHVSNNFFGLNEDNYMGALHQSNSLSNRWIDFFIQQRLEPQIKLSFDNNLVESIHVHQFQNLYKKLPEIFFEEPPALLHGDLWSGNFLCDENSNPALIDPAVYFGSRHIDLAMTTLFGGFDKSFYESYHYHFNLPDNHREMWDVCNLYPLLIHLNLFGKGYLNEILNITRRY